MEAANGTTTPKVIAQFSDPYGLFDDVAPLLQNRLPLGNLHWKSPTRPLRSIEELDVSLEKQQTTTSDGTAGFRRHQIPGLHQTPFVKVLLLRCDDKEKYKEVLRQDTKDWVKSLGVSTTTGKPTTKGQERHDAFEYIIVHVVLPGTAAASQPRSSKHISLEASESTDSVNSKSKWTGKSTSTIYDKLRADFASSSKAPFERVAQVRLSDPAKPNTVISPLEIEEQWQDLVEKLKTAILQSLDARVAQYEEDIRERDAQRNLPGWNFCTFFILKEGLARGFENVGLLEDAIQIYEELDAGLDALIQDHAKDDYSDAANALLPYATDLKDIIRSVLDNQSNSNGTSRSNVALSLKAWTDVEENRFPWRLERRDYQQMILTNQVSALDFRIYIFIRQMRIMLRRAAMPVPLSKGKKVDRHSPPRWDADILCDICERSIRFMNLASRNLRQDLFAAWGGQEGLPQEEQVTQKIAIDNIVASWKWSSLLQTLSDCQIIRSFSSLTDRTNGQAEHGQLFSPADIASSQMPSNHKMSISTIASSDAGTDTSNDVSNAPVVKDIFASLRVVKGSKSDLIFWAAELFAIMRTLFLQLCQQSNLLPKALRAPVISGRQIEDLSLAKIGLRAPSLASIIDNEYAALEAYKLLTVCACQCYTTAKRTRTSRQLLFDLATLETHLGNYDGAASWLDVIPGFLESPPRTSIEHSMLDLYINCLRGADRQPDLLKSLLIKLQSTANTAKYQRQIYDTWTELMKVAEDIGPIPLPSDSVFALERIDPHISHSSENGCCQIAVHLRCLRTLQTSNHIRARLKCRGRDKPSPSTIEFTGSMEARNNEDHVQFTLTSPILIQGWVDVIGLSISVGNLDFEYALHASQTPPDEFRSVSDSARDLTELFIYPPDTAPIVEAAHSTDVNLVDKKYVSINISWGAMAVERATVKLRPASAGLRLDLVLANLVNGEHFELRRLEDSHVLDFSTISTASQSTFEFPYTFDDGSATYGSIYVELRYIVGSTQLEMYDTIGFSTILPIAVNVQDTFQSRAIFSRFTFTPATSMPISVLGAKLSGSRDLEVVSESTWSASLDVFSRQSLSWVVQMREEGLQRHNEMVLDVSYRCIDEVVVKTILQNFQQILQSSVHSHTSRPLFAHLTSVLPKLWTQQMVEMSMLSGELDMPGYEEFGWDSAIGIFSKTTRATLRGWLQKWHDSHASLLMRYDAGPLRTLRLLVEPSSAQIIVTAELKCVESSSCVVGLPVLVRINAYVHSHAGLEAELTIEVTGQPENWLVGGQRRVAFLVGQEQHEGSIVLIPQNTGSLLLPGIEVRCRDVSARNAGKPIPVEVENLSAATTVFVRSNVRSTTIELGDGETATGHWLVDSRQISGNT